MNRQEISRSHTAISDLLERERRTLLAGQIELLDDIFREKERLFSEFSDAPSPDESTLEQLRDKIGRNHQLFESALEGIRTVQDRLSELRRVRSGLDVYGQSGRKEHLGTGHSQKMEKRA